MKSKRLINSNHFFSFLLSLLLVAVIIPFVQIGEKYELNIVNEFSSDPGIIRLYRDIDHDGTSEELYIRVDFEGISAIIYKVAGRETFEWNLHGKLIDDYYSICTGDYNNDGIDELFAITYSNDSIFLNSYDVKNQREVLPPLFLSKFKWYHNKLDVDVYYSTLRDLKHNGNKELILSINSGFSKSIRKVFVIDLQKGTFRASPKAGTVIYEHLYFSDLNHDGSDEITGNIFAPGNYSKNPSFPFSDMYLWFYVYNADLKFLFEPLKLGNHPGKVQVQPIKIGKNNLMAIFVRQGIKDSTFLAVANEYGKILNHRVLRDTIDENDFYFKVYSDRKDFQILLYQQNNGLIEYYTKDLKRRKIINSVSCSKPYEFDLDNDGVKEQVYFEKDLNYLVVARNDFTNPVIIKIKRNYGEPYFSVKWKNGIPVSLCLSIDDKYFEFQYKTNPLYTYRFFIYAGLFLLIFFIVNLIGIYYQGLIKKRYKSLEIIRANQIRSLEQQLNPHFTLNIINSISSLYEKKDTATARNFMSKYSKLLRETLLFSGEISTSLNNEIEFVRNYLELERLRHNNKFDYSISCKVNDMFFQIPRFLIFTFVENALKHGCFPLIGTELAIIKVDCNETKESIIIEISDNGIGRKKAAKMKSHSTGKGLEIMEESLRLYNELKSNNITFNIEDFDTKSKNTGTKVTIYINKSKKR